MHLCVSHKCFIRFINIYWIFFVSMIYVKCYLLIVLLLLLEKQFFHVLFKSNWKSSQLQVVRVHAVNTMYVNKDQFISFFWSLFSFLILFYSPGVIKSGVLLDLSRRKHIKICRSVHMSISLKFDKCFSFLNWRTHKFKFVRSSLQIEILCKVRC